MSIFKQLGDKFFSSKFPMVGVDISDTSIEFVQLQTGLGKPKIKANYRLELEPGLVTNGRISDLSKVAMILKAAFKKEMFKTNFCLLSLPDKETFFVNIKGENLDTEIYSLAQENLPIDLGQCYYDYVMVDENEAFFVAAPKEIIKQYQSLFNLADLNLAVIDFESACLMRALITPKELKQPTFIIDLGAKSTDIILVDSHGFRDQVNFAVGGYFLSQKVADHLKQDFALAEKIKVEQGIKIEGLDLESILNEMFAPIMAEIKKMSAEYEEQTGQIARHVILAGGTSMLKGINEIFIKNLPGYQLAKGDLAKKIEFGDQELEKDKILYGNVIGLALRGVNSDSLNQGINLIKNLNN
jgi:type IV pilus assembly protein PilM